MELPSEVSNSPPWSPGLGGPDPSCPCRSTVLWPLRVSWPCGLAAFSTFGIAGGAPCSSPDFHGTHGCNGVLPRGGRCRQDCRMSPSHLPPRLWWLRIPWSWEEGGMRSIRGCVQVCQAPLNAHGEKRFITEVIFFFSWWVWWIQ